jgi:Rrf2 family protein
MIYSATTEYAIRALAHMATLPPGERILARDLAAATGVPRQFLGKILHRLARLGLLDSAKGRGGGFRFLRPPDQILVAELVEAVEGEDIMRLCVLGLSECSDQAACPVHDQWVTFRDRLKVTLHSASMAELGRNLKAKRNGRLDLTETIKVTEPQSR